MHLLGNAISITRKGADGMTSTLLDIPAWNLHWQGSYQIETPIPLSANDELSWGEGTTDEMCLAGLQTVNHLPAAP